MKIMTESLTDLLISKGADLVGFGDLTALPPNVRQNLPVGVCVAVKYPRDVVIGIYDMPPREYYEQYDAINDQLDDLVTTGELFLKEHGYSAIAQTRDFVAKNITHYTSLLPHKTVATRAGLGWIGKSALLVTPEFGSALRISSILTDAPLTVSVPYDLSLCGDCTACEDACPAKAIKGQLWDTSTPRDQIFDPAACRKDARRRAQRFGMERMQCGKCMEICPHTQQYTHEAIPRTPKGACAP
ncbi:MAG: 4Fe-4S binding protein [Oscillospiraceae bacterium]|nr:4Fe-4S binding protein [Oscillospiraceae bacterium]